MYITLKELTFLKVDSALVLTMIMLNIILNSSTDIETSIETYSCYG